MSRILGTIKRKLSRWALVAACGPIGVGFVIAAAVSRFSKRSVDVGLGPEPMINNIYHRKALRQMGYTVETFVSHVYYITEDFDVKCLRKNLTLASMELMLKVLFRYRCIYIYFNGGPLAWSPLKRLEPYLYKLAGIKVLVMPYGGDVDDMTRCPNYAFRHALVSDYPLFQKTRRPHIVRQIERWTEHADIVLSGCDWVDYTYHWDVLTLAHFSIDTTGTRAEFNSGRHDGPIRILHAPNHQMIKGTKYFEKAIRELRDEGVDVELVVVSKVPNEEIKRLIAECDVVADQLVVGWYAMFALEGMAAGRPVLCYLRPELVDLYTFAGLVEPDEIPIVQCSYRDVKETVRSLVENRAELAEIGRKSRGYAEKHHSTEAIGALFDRLNRQMGIEPSGR
ncbi:glycosyltransferase involved in cell wall biosynthesis [Desulfomicrobium macestii]|uniref:Glycosyltransferase involved in cell wall biosynthesis n=1 Tax=Desulfomicrobium macestii TaxID=90731 RepID=A0ABR9H6R8_9BACT|nr:hypothetical protein [Desulfomicrobium macestii]MBE1426397.1 glycosyltransferase involved in cell wall biosynthesis [Desulfomicrobium macestii]